MKLFFWKSDRKRDQSANVTAIAPMTEPAAAARRSPQDGHDMIEIDQLDDAARIFVHGPHAELGRKTLRLPDWFDFDLDPDGPEFRTQQLRLWEAITARENYDPSVNEDCPEVGGLDAWRQPGFYASGSSYVVGEQLLGMGLILVRSAATPASRVIEYGAGFGQNAVAFARFGCKVDTVDINPGFCSAVTTQAERFQIDLTAHAAPFGYNPAGKDGVYNVILFSECFHHCWDFPAVIPQLEKMLAPDGKILLAGESIYRGPQAPMPTDWGIRLEWETVAVMRIRGWMELGFREEYLTRQFMNHGFIWGYHAVPQAIPANLYEFVRWTHPTPMQAWPMSPAEESVWHAPQHGGRWSRGASYLRLPRYHGIAEMTCICHHSSGRDVELSWGEERLTLHFSPGERKTIRLAMSGLPDQDLKITSNTDRLDTEFPDELGIFVETFGPVPNAD